MITAIREPHTQVRPARFVTIELCAALTGFSQGAIRTKIRDGHWLDGQEYTHSPDGRVLIDLKGYEAWVQRG